MVKAFIASASLGVLFTTSKKKNEKKKKKEQKGKKKDKRILPYTNLFKSSDGTEVTTFLTNPEKDFFLKKASIQPAVRVCFI